MKLLIRALIYCLALTIFLYGCTTNGNQSNLNSNTNNGLTKTGSFLMVDQSPSEQAIQKVLAYEEITDVKAVNSGEEIIIAFKAKQMERLHLNEIQKRIENDMKQLITDKKVWVSKDSKIFMELEKIDKQLKNKDIDKQKLEKRMGKLTHWIQEEIKHKTGFSE